MMTIHIAKGLEFEYVFVISVMDGIFPSQKTMDENGHDGLEEERRLCYVAFTRAKRKLYVTCNKSYSFVLESYAIQSRFINEAGLKTEQSEYKTKKSSFGQIHSSSSFGFYSDEPAYDDFVSSLVSGNQSKPKEEPKPKRNDVEWSPGDIAIHDVFGRGVVLKVIDNTILDIEFESCGRKSILASHPKVHKEEKGGQA